MRFIRKTPEVLVDANVWSPEIDTTDDPVSLEQEPHLGADGKPILFGILHTHTSQLRVNPGDWVLKFADILDKDGNVVTPGELAVRSPKDFEEQFAPYDMAGIIPPTLAKRLAKSSKADE